MQTLNYDSGDPLNKGYRHDEALQMAEFCVELDNQDDRLKHPDETEFHVHIDPTLWNPVPAFDSRRLVAQDTLRFHQGTLGPRLQRWNKLYEKNIRHVKRKHGAKHATWDENTIYADPDLNGFGPWQNAWLLYEGRGPFAGSYTIAIRGTVFTNTASATANVFFHPVLVRQFLSRAVQFADMKNASLHSGFAHATFTLLLDDRYGIMRVLHDLNLSSNTRLLIAGHSQGAAMATITHAFLHYALRNDNSGAENIFGLNGKTYALKSYGIAQPKPGNYYFAADFARITQQHDSAIVINNHIDTAPKVPITLQDTGDLDEDYARGSFAVHALQFIAGFGKNLRRLLSIVSEPFVRVSAVGYGDFFQSEKIRPLGGDIMGSSWNFVPAGHVIYVYGTVGAPGDTFHQHHATTYRQLIQEQLKP